MILLTICQQNKSEVQYFRLEISELLELNTFFGTAFCLIIASITVRLFRVHLLLIRSFFNGVAYNPIAGIVHLRFAEYKQRI